MGSEEITLRIARELSIQRSQAERILRAILSVISRASGQQESFRITRPTIFLDEHWRDNYDLIGPVPETCRMENELLRRVQRRLGYSTSRTETATQAVLQAMVKTLWEKGYLRIEGHGAFTIGDAESPAQDRGRAPADTKAIYYEPGAAYGESEDIPAAKPDKPPKRRRPSIEAPGEREISIEPGDEDYEIVGGEHGGGPFIEDEFEYDVTDGIEYPAESGSPDIDTGWEEAGPEDSGGWEEAGPEESDGWEEAGPENGDDRDSAPPRRRREPRGSVEAPPDAAEEVPSGHVPHEESSESATKDEEKRRVNVQLFSNGKQRGTFLAGAENTIRCWIGLPEPERAAVADKATPRVAIPREGLDLQVELLWRDQKDVQPLRLPANRNARTADCDLKLTIPDGEPYINAEIAFLYRGSVFEYIRVGAFVINPGEAEQPHQEINVRVDISQRQVIKLPNRSSNHSAIIWGGDEPDPASGDEPSPGTTLRVFGSRARGIYSLKETTKIIKLLNSKLFQSGRLLGLPKANDSSNKKNTLDIAHRDVLEILRQCGRTGALLFNHLELQNFFDGIGERIQIINREPQAYVPVEFIYDRGYPADDAVICEAGVSALAENKDRCPVCKPYQELSEDERDLAKVICPYGFWSLQKIIERRDPQVGINTASDAASPSENRQTLPAIKSVLFASSAIVTPEDIQATADALKAQFPHYAFAEDWRQWRTQVKQQEPQLLLMMPHHGIKGSVDYLEIGDKQVPEQDRRLSQARLRKSYVNPGARQPGPVVVLFGCETVATSETGYVQLARHFQYLDSAIVVGTLAKVRGRNAAPVARALALELATVKDSKSDFATIMRKLRRQMLAKGYLMALYIVALGDAEWRFSPD